MTKLHLLFLIISLLIASAAACAPLAASPTPDLSLAYTQAYATAFAALQPTATPIPTDTLIPPPTAIRTPPALPETFATTRLNPFDPPHTYIPDTCQYIYDKWNSNNAWWLIGIFHYSLPPSNNYLGIYLFDCLNLGHASSSRPIYLYYGGLHLQENLEPNDLIR